MRDDDVPRAAADFGLLVLQVEVDTDATARFERHVELEPRLLSEHLEERGHATHTFVVQIGHRVVPVVTDGRSGAEREAVADEQDAPAVCSVTDHARREDQAGDERGPKCGRELHRSPFLK